MLVGALVYLFIGGVFAALHNISTPEQISAQELCIVIAFWPFIIIFLMIAVLRYPL